MSHTTFSVITFSLANPVTCIRPNAPVKSLNIVTWDNTRTAGRYTLKIG
jgi:hypothetical protein